MKDTNQTETETEELTSYERLLRELDDDAKAYEFKAKSLDRAQNLIADILSVTTGNDVVTVDNSEWGHGHFIELFEIVSIRHKNFYVPDFIENLKAYVYTWTFGHEEARRNWTESILADRGLDEYGIAFEKQVENDDPNNSDAPEVETESNNKEKMIGAAEIDNLALVLSGLLNNPNLPSGIYNSLKVGLDDAFNDLPTEANIELSSWQDSPEYLAKLIQLSK
jgi:hypothetical protein